MTRTTKSILLGVSCGLLEYIINLTFSIIPYYTVPSSMFRVIIVMLTAAGAILALAALLYKNNSVCQTLFRWLCISCSFLFFFLINAYIGTIRILRGFLDINIDSATENICGILSLGFFAILLVVCFVVCLVTVVVAAITKFVRLHR